MIGWVFLYRKNFKPRSLKCNRSKVLSFFVYFACKHNTGSRDFPVSYTGKSRTWTSFVQGLCRKLFWIIDAYCLKLKLLGRYTQNAQWPAGGRIICCKHWRQYSFSLHYFFIFSWKVNQAVKLAGSSISLKDLSVCSTYSWIVLTYTSL